MAMNPTAPVYDAADLAILQQAYCSACREIDIDPYPSDASAHKATREALARAILDVASTGLRDRRLLGERALEKVVNPGASAG